MCKLIAAVPNAIQKTNKAYNYLQLYFTASPVLATYQFSKWIEGPTLKGRRES